MSFAAVAGGVLHWRSDGPADAPVLALANSLGSDLRIWDDVAAGLARDFRVIRYDQRGHGLSDVADACSIDAHASDLATLLDHAGVGRCALAGISLGGMIVQRFTARWPDRVASLVLCDTATRIGTAELWNARIAAIGSGGMAALAEAVLPRWFAPGYATRAPAAFAGWRNMLLRTPAAGYAAACAALRDADLTTAAAAIGVPCLCVVGEADVSTPPALVRGLAASIPGADFALVAEAGHLPCIEQPEHLAALIGAHLTRSGRHAP